MSDIIRVPVMKCFDTVFQVEDKDIILDSVVVFGLEDSMTCSDSINYIISVANGKKNIYPLYEYKSYLIKFEKVYHKDPNDNKPGIISQWF